MALNSSTLNTLIQAKLTAAGFNIAESQVAPLAQAIAEAVIEHITSSAQVVVTGGSSAGTYPVA